MTWLVTSAGAISSDIDDALFCKVRVEIRDVYSLQAFKGYLKHVVATPYMTYQYYFLEFI